MTIMSKDVEGCLLAWPAEHLGKSHTLKWFCHGFTLTCQVSSSKMRSSVFSKQHSTAA